VCGLCEVCFAVWLYEQYNMEILLLYWIEMGFLGLLVRILEYFGEGGAVCRLFLTYKIVFGYF